MKKLLLKKITNPKTGKHTYAILEDGKVIASRKSNRNYIACYVLNDMSTPFFFGRVELIGKGDSGRINQSEIYGIAHLESN